MSKEIFFYIEKYIEFIFAQKNLSKNTILSYENDLKELVRFFGKKDPLIYSNEDIKDYIFFLSRKYSPKTHCRKLSSVKNFFLFLVESNLIKRNPVENFSFPKIPKSVPKFLSESEINQLIEKSNEDKTLKGLRLTLQLEILYVTGIRVSELVNIKNGDINDDLSFIIIKGKGGDQRIVPIFGKVLDILKMYIDALRSSQNGVINKFLFPSNSKEGHLTRNRFFQILKDLANKINLDPARVSPHIIRHSFASHLLNRGVDLRIIQESLGHKDISTTQIYTHIQPTKLRKILEKKHSIDDELKKFKKLS